MGSYYEGRLPDRYLFSCEPPDSVAYRREVDPAPNRSINLLEAIARNDRGSRRRNVDEMKDEMPTYQRVLMTGIQLTAYRERSSRYQARAQGMPDGYREHTYRSHQWLCGRCFLDEME